MLKSAMPVSIPISPSGLAPNSAAFDGLSLPVPFYFFFLSGDIEVAIKQKTFQATALCCRPRRDRLYELKGPMSKEVNERASKQISALQ